MAPGKHCLSGLRPCDGSQPETPVSAPFVFKNFWDWEAIPRLGPGFRSLEVALFAKIGKSFRERLKLMSFILAVNTAESEGVVLETNVL